MEFTNETMDYIDHNNDAFLAFECEDGQWYL